MGDKPDCKTEATWWKAEDKKYSYAGVTTIDGGEYRVYAYLKEDKPAPAGPPPTRADEDVPWK